MDHDAQEAHAQSEELSSHMEPSYRSGPITTLLRWEGSCVGDDVSSIGAYALRIVAIQAADCTGNLPTWVKQVAMQLHTTRGDDDTTMWVFGRYLGPTAGVPWRRVVSTY